MFGLMRAKGVVNRKLTRNRKTADAIGRAGASVFGAPPKVETKAEMYRKRAQEERENVATVDARRRTSSSSGAARGCADVRPGTRGGGPAY